MDQLNDFFWEEPREYSKAEAWIDLLKSASQDKEIKSKIFNGKVVRWGKGELVISIRSLKERWGWASNGKVMRFLGVLEKQNRVVIETEQQRNTLSICEYSTYMQRQNGNGTPTERQRNTDSASVDKKLQGEKDKKETQIERLARLNNIDIELAKKPLSHLSTNEFKIPKDQSDTDDGINYLTMAFFEAMPQELQTDNSIANKLFVKWRNTIRLIHEQDERPLKQIYKGIVAFSKDTFWNNACQSPQNLRDNFLKIKTSVNKNGTKKRPSKDGFDHEKAKRDLAGLRFNES